MASSDDDDPTTNVLDEDLNNGTFDDVHQGTPIRGSAFLQESIDESSPPFRAGSNSSPPPFTLGGNAAPGEAHYSQYEHGGWANELPEVETTQKSTYEATKPKDRAGGQSQASAPVASSTVKSNPNPVKKRGIEEEDDGYLPHKKDPKPPSAPVVAPSSPRALHPSKPRQGLETRVYDPRVVGTGTSDKHVEYQVDTVVESNLAQVSFDGHTKFSVFRRFSDFYWLRDTLEQKYPGFIIPPLPDKTVPILQNNLSERFFLSRARSLDYFLSHVASHAVLSRDVAVKDFLIAEQARFEQVRKPSISGDIGAPAAVQVVSSATAGLFEKVFDWGQNIGTTLNSTISGAARVGAQRRERDPSDDRFDEAQRYINELEPKIKFVHDTAKQLVEKNQTLSKALHELGLAFTNMGQSEQQGQLGDAVTELGNVCNGRDGLSILVNLQADREQVKFLEPIEDYVRLVNAAKQALVVRMKTAQAYEYALGDLTLKRAARDKMAPNDSRIPTAENEIVEAQHRVESTKEDFVMVTDRVLKEVERFKREKSQDFKSLVLQYVQLQIDHNRAVEQLWKSVLPRLHRVKAPSEKDVQSGHNDDV